VRDYSDPDKLPTSNIEAEQYTLGAMMLSPQAVAEVTEVVSPPDFIRPVHQQIFHALVAMFAADEPVTPVTLLAWMRRDGTKIDPLYLAELFGLPVVAPQATAHARIVWDHAVRRNIENLGVRMAQMAGYLPEDPAELLAKAQQMLNQMTRGMSPDGDQALSSADFLALTGRATEPVIPGLLDHQERVIVVGGEGTGKTTLAFQVGYALASGVHPFVSEQIRPGKVLIVDLENPVEILKRRVRRLIRTAEAFPGWDDRNMAIWARPGGVDMTSPAQAFKLAEVIRREQPDLVVAGPLYKMLPGGEVSEHMHATICRFWDVMRARYDCAVWLETHAPMASNGADRQMRPLGSGVYSRWPEFGISLVKRGRGVLAVERFRGDREEGRSWPERLTRNAGGGWPWAAVYAPGTFTR
jgi:replicative DNA helicase